MVGGARHDLMLTQSRAGEEHRCHGAGGQQRDRVDEERCAQGPRRQRAAEGGTGDGPQQEPGLVGAGSPAALVGRHDAQQQRERRHGEHRRAEAADTPQHEELWVAAREPGQQAGHPDDADPGGQHHPLAEAVDQPAGHRRRGEAHQREHRDDRTRGEVADAEVLGEQRDRRGDDPEAQGHRERHGGEDRHLGRQGSEGVA